MRATSMCASGVSTGENVPSERVNQAFELLREADMLLVLGSSLTVYSGYRFAVAARNSDKPVVILNDGPTRADDDASIKIESRLGTTLQMLHEHLEMI